MSKRAIVVGAGISGLAAAFKLAERGVTVTVLEATDEPGGSIKTVHRDGFLLEAGPDSFLTEKPAALELCRTLQIEDQVIATNSKWRRSFIALDGQLHPIPQGFYLLAPVRLGSFLATPLLSWPGKLRAAADLWLPRGPEQADESLASFVRRRFGAELLERLAQPLVAGIYTADMETLSLRATFPKFLDMETQHRSVILGLRKRNAARTNQAASHSTSLTASGARYGLFATLKDGLGTLVKALLARLPAGGITYGESVTNLSRAASGWRLDTHGGRTYEVDAVCLALPAHVAGRLLKPVDETLAGLLQGIRYASTATVNLGYAREQIGHPLDGFGFVVPASEGRRLLAVTFSHVKFPDRAPEGKALLRAFVGGALQPAVAEMEARELAQLVHHELQALLDISGSPLFSEIHRHPRSMPQYEVGHLDRVAQIRGRVHALPNLALAGNAYDGIGLPDCIASGESAATALLDA